MLELVRVVSKAFKKEHHETKSNHAEQRKEQKNPDIGHYRNLVWFRDGPPLFDRVKKHHDRPDHSANEPRSQNPKNKFRHFYLLHYMIAYCLKKSRLALNLSKEYNKKVTINGVKAKTMRKIIIIAIVIIIIVVAGWFLWPQKTNQLSPQEKACVDSGGTVQTANCCKTASDFPNNCLIGACGCSLDNSKEIKICDCGDGCWDGIKCVKSETPAEQAIKEILATKYEKDIADVVVNITKSDDAHVAGNVFFLMDGQQGEGGMVLAVKENNEWKVVYDGNGSVDCPLLKNTYQFTDEMLIGFCD